MKQIWFKAKRYGWGWYPSSWQGWSIMAVFALVFILIISRASSTFASPNRVITEIVLPCFIITALLIIICYLTGEKPEWRWGNKPIKSEKTLEK